MRAVGNWSTPYAPTGMISNNDEMTPRLRCKWVILVSIPVSEELMMVKDGPLFWDSTRIEILGIDGYLVVF